MAKPLAEKGVESDCVIESPAIQLAYRKELYLEQRLSISEETATAITEVAKYQYAVPAVENTKQEAERTKQYAEGTKQHGITFLAVFCGIGALLYRPNPNGMALVGLVAVLGGVYSLNRWIDSRKR
jgi:hypothetical protein